LLQRTGGGDEGRADLPVGLSAPVPVAQDGLGQHGEDEQDGAVDHGAVDHVQHAEDGDAHGEDEADETVEVAADPSQLSFHRPVSPRFFVSTW